MKLGTGKYQVIWNKLPQKRLKGIHDCIKYQKLEPLSAERLTQELIDFGNELGNHPKVFPILKELSNNRFTYRPATYKKVYRFIFRLNESKAQLIIVDIFHNKRHPNQLSRKR